MDNFTVLSIPEISNERQIWLIRTNGGLYYNDFTTNKYVALGWDAVSVDLLLNSSISNDAKKEKINGYSALHLYMNETYTFVKYS